jgi:hypothetical protein
MLWYLFIVFIVIYLGDFGISKITRSSELKTSTLSIVGTWYQKYGKKKGD